VKNNFSQRKGKEKLRRARLEKEGHPLQFMSLKRLKYNCDFLVFVAVLL